MKPAPLISLAFVIAALASSTSAAAPDEHSGHHAAASAVGGVAKSKAPEPSTEVRWMHAQINAMNAMHEKMAAAPTQEARNALMSEHMKTLAAGIAMMKDMPREMSGMKPTNGTAQCHPNMEQHMAMIGAAMDMMSDRLSQPTR